MQFILVTFLVYKDIIDFISIRSFTQFTEFSIMFSSSVGGGGGEGYLLGLGVVLDNPSFYDHTALQPIILHHQHLFF